MVDGVETRVVEERETKNGKLVEVARNHFAISKRTNNVFYFGEDVEMYKDGKVVNHDGSWLSGVDGGKFGLMMPGRPLLKASYYQEVVPKVAMDRATILSTTETVKAPAGEFTNCLNDSAAAFDGVQVLRPRHRDGERRDDELVKAGNVALKQ